MRPLNWLLAAFAWLTVAAHSWRLGPLPAATLTLLGAVVLSVSTSQRMSIEGIVATSIGTLLAELLGASILPFGLGLGFVTAGVFFERTLRVRSRRAKIAHAALSAIAGTIAAGVATSYSGAAWPLNAAAFVFAVVILASPFLINADDAIAATLAWSAREIGGDTGARLEHAAQLRKHAAHASLDASTRRTVEAAWLSLLRAADERVRLGATQSSPFAARKIARIDSDLERYIVSIERLFCAAEGLHTTRDAAGELAIDDAHTAGTALEEARRVLARE